MKGPCLHTHTHIYAKLLSETTLYECVCVCVGKVKKQQNNLFSEGIYLEQ